MDQNHAPFIKQDKTLSRHCPKTKQTKDENSYKGSVQYTVLLSVSFWLDLAETNCPACKG